MHIIIAPDGWISIEVENAVDAVELVKSMRNDVAVPELIPAGAWAGTPWTVGKAAHPEDNPTQEYAEAQMTGKPAKIQMTRSPALPPTLQEVYDYLTDNDQPEGLSRTEVAEGLGLKVITVDTRLRTLRRMGFLDQPSRGKWGLA